MTDLTRRQLFRRAAGIGAAGAVSSVLGAGSLASRAVAGAASRVRLQGRTTLDVVVRRGDPGPTGWRRVSTGPGEPHRLRRDLGGRTSTRRLRRRRPLLAFGQITDVHVVDVQSPLRVEWTDRYEDPGNGGLALGLFSSAYRPAEMLSAQVAESMVRQIAAVQRGPATGRPLDLVVQTGDNSDNGQYNEVRWNIDLLDGGTITPDSGDRTRFEGVADDDPTTYDPHYYHPEGTPEGATTAVDDQPRAQYGFPVVPGLLAAARRPFRARGLGLPWITAFGNHDGLVQGNFPHDAALDQLARGSVKVITPPASITQTDVLRALTSGDVAGLVAQITVGPGAKQVTPDDDRRLLSRAEIVEEHFSSTGLPLGHGFTEQNRTDGTAYYAFDHGRRFRFLVLDTVNPNGQSDGSLDQAQFDWLQAQIAGATGRYVIVCSHHTSTSMGNTLVATGGDPGQRVTGDAVVAALLAAPRVIAWVNGHTHRNTITPHQRADGSGGFWEINTAAHIDWPQQSRIIEVVDNRDGTLSILTTILDHAAPVGAAGTGSVLALASLSRELAANDWQERTTTRAGDPSDRNRELLLPKPSLG